MFNNLIGQEKLKRQLNFYVDSFNITREVPALMFSGARGLGKTTFANCFAKQLETEDGDPRPLIEINSSTIKNNQDFFDEIYTNYIEGNEIALLLDEAHALPKDFVMMMLTVLNTQGESIREVSFDGVSYVFDLSKLVIIFATTELDKIFTPLKDRLTIVDFEPYKESELEQIIKLNCPCDFNPHTLRNIAQTVRGNARSAIKRSKEITMYAKSKGINNFQEEHWKDLSYQLGINPLGLTNLEIQILQALHNRGESSLQVLSAVTGMSRTALQRDGEVYLLQKNLMKIDGKRHITNEGNKIVKMTAN